MKLSRAFRAILRLDSLHPPMPSSPAATASSKVRPMNHSKSSHPVFVAAAVLGLTAVMALFIAKATAATPEARRTVVIENFDSYTNDTQVAEAWYKPHHGAPVHQTLDSVTKGGGKQSLKIAYATTKEPETHYAPFCRVAKWDLSGCNAAQFWLKPDGSGRQLTFQLNIANKEGKNIHDLWQTVYLPKKGDTAGRVVTIPFSALEHNVKYADSPDTSPVFKPEAVIEVAFYIGGRNDEPGEGVYYFDEIVGVHDATLPAK